MYYFLLGQSPELSIAEIDTVLKRLGSKTTFSVIHPQILEVSTLPLPPASLIGILGGTVKILEEVGSVNAVDSSIQTIVNDLVTIDAKPAFIITSFDTHINTFRLSQEIKKQLTSLGRPSRFRETNNPLTSAGVVELYHEYHLITNQKSIIIAKTIVAQDIDRWNVKDYGRPSADARSGMLPPKIARIMVNLATPTCFEKALLLDPFCGSGTILMEAIDLGYCVIGSDINTKSVNFSQKNLEWYVNAFNKPKDYQIFQSDATHLTPKDIKEPIDAIVFEGYLGPPNIADSQIDNYHKGLTKLYKGVLKNLYPLLKPEGKMIAALPAFVTSYGVKNMDSLIAWCETIGYKQFHSPMEYARPQAKIKRRIYLLQKSLI